MFALCLFHLGGKPSNLVLVRYGFILVYCLYQDDGNFWIWNLLLGFQPGVRLG